MIFKIPADYLCPENSTQCSSGIEILPKRKIPAFDFKLPAIKKFREGGLNKKRSSMISHLKLFP